MFKKFKEFINHLYNNVKSTLLKYLPNTLVTQSNLDVESKIVKTIINKNHFNYRIIFSPSKSLLDINQLKLELQNLKDFLQIGSNFIRINGQLLFYLDNVKEIQQCQTKTYSMKLETYDLEIQNLVKDLVFLSERYNIKEMTDISFNVILYTDTYKLTKKDFRHLK